MSRAFLPAVLAPFCVLVSGCGASREGGGGSAGSGGQTQQLYAINSAVIADEGTTTYIALLDNLEMDEVDLGQARENPGYATVAVSAGKVFVSDGEAPVVTRYGLDERDRLVEEEQLNFAAYGLMTAPAYTNVFVGPSTAFMNLEQTKRIVWDPSAMAIEATVDTPGLLAERDGKKVFAAYDRGIAVRSDGVFQAYNWSDPDFYAYDAGSQIGVYDTETGELDALLDAPCPMLDSVTTDEDGNLYFSIWSGTIGYRLIDEDAPKSCLVRIKAGEQTIDSAWTRRFEDLTGGRETGRFYYLADGIGIVEVYHHERVTIDAMSDPRALWFSENWRLWRVDLNADSAEPIEGLGWFAAGFTPATLHGRHLVLLPTKDLAATTGYELALDGTLTERFRINGWAYQLITVR